MSEPRISKLNPERTLFKEQPAEFLVRFVAQELLKVTQFKALFGENIHPYKKMDYSIRELPAMRIYNDRYNKNFDSWFVEGEIVIETMMPADIRREETQYFQDIICGAVLAQFRRPSFFTTMCDLVPGLNELGKTVSVDKALGFEWENQIVPLTRITLNFRIDLREWDDSVYPESDRTKDSPFEAVLGDLERIVSVIDGLRDDFESNIQVEIDQTIEQDT